MLLLVPCLLLLVRGTTQYPQNTGSIANHGSHTPPEYRTNFSCVGRVAGYYADIDSGCQLYHLCDGDGRRFTHACPNATLFQQRMMICDHWYMVNCNKSVHDYSANLLIGQRDKPFVGADHNHHREPVSFFSISSLQQPNWFPVVGVRHEKGPEDSENAVPSPPPTISAIHIAYTPPPPPPPPNKEIQSSSPPERRARNRNINNSYKSPVRSPATTPTPPTTNARYVDRRVDTSVSPEKVSVFPQNPQTKPSTQLPDVYKNNPYFQSFISKPTQTPSYVSFTSPSPATPQINAAQQTRGQSSDSRSSVRLGDIANLRISHSQTLPQVSNRRTKEYPIHFENNRTQNLPPKVQKPADHYSYNPYLESLSNTKTAETATTSRNTVPYPPVPQYNEDDLNNVVELHLLDPRRMFYIPESRTHEVDRGNSTVLFISVPAPVRNNHPGVMQFRKYAKVLKGQNPECPKCYPGFLIPGRCYPCVVIR